MNRTAAELRKEVKDAYAAHDANPSAETYLRVVRAIYANTKYHNPHELEEPR